MRTLRRPMFRGGSTGTGITSGLAPRQGYAGNDDASNQRVETLGDLRNLPLSDLRKLSQSMAYQPRGTNVYDFLTEFGLGMASTPPTGNIFQTAAQVARAPYERFTQRKSQADLQKYASEADMFKTLISAQAKVQAGAAESGAGVKEGYSQRIREGLDKIWGLKDKLDAGDISQQDYNRQKNRIIQGLGPYMKDSPEVERLFEIEDYAEEAYEEHKAKFLTEDLMDDPDNPGTQITQREYYSRPENKAELRQRATNSYMKEFQERRLGIYESKKSGGRVGYANAGPVMGQTMPTVPDETMPEELGGISYDELRARLPQEVTDDVVHLLANSKEALEDFATIQTEQDVANFNKKYGVNLVLPAEG